MGEPIVCLICGSGAEPHYRVAQYSMYRCSRCRTAFLWPMPSSEQLRDYYSSYHLSDEEGGIYDVIESRIRRTFVAKAELVKRTLGHESGIRLLDVGCGKGFFVKTCVEHGIDAEGIDISES